MEEPRKRGRPRKHPSDTRYIRKDIWLDPDMIKTIEQLPPVEGEYFRSFSAKVRKLLHIQLGK